VITRSRVSSQWCTCAPSRYTKASPSHADVSLVMSVVRTRAISRRADTSKITRSVGTCSPPFRALAPEEDAAIVALINDSRPDVLWVGLGLPKQERWIHEHLDRLRVPVIVGVGAAFGFASGRVSRAPEWIGRLGFEWVWRLAAEPRKLWRRDLLDGPRFLFHAFLETAGLRKYD